MCRALWWLSGPLPVGGQLRTCGMLFVSLFGVTPLLMNMRITLVVLAVVVAWATWMFRWEVVPVATDVYPVAYQLDRWTGDVYFLGSPRNGRSLMPDR